MINWVKIYLFIYLGEWLGSCSTTSSVANVAETADVANVAYLGE